MKWWRREAVQPTAAHAPSTRALYERGVLTYSGPCVCHFLDIGPRCGSCVARCASQGHIRCFCGDPNDPGAGASLFRGGKSGADS